MTITFDGQVAETFLDMINMGVRAAQSGRSVEFMRVLKDAELDDEFLELYPVVATGMDLELLNETFGA